MKKFAQILGKILLEREETLKKQKELAGEIIESALKQFSDLAVVEVVIYNEPKGISVDCYNKKNEVVEVDLDPAAGKIKTRYSNLCYSQVVYGIIEEIMLSEDEDISNLEDQIIVVVNQNEPKNIRFKLEEDA